MPRITVVGVDHDLQWKDDPTGHLKAVLSAELVAGNFGLMAEEALGLPTTVGQRLACKLNIPWLQVEMSISEREKAGITRRVSSPISPLEDIGGITEYDLTQDGLREEHWIQEILRWRVDQVLLVCGFLHISPVAGKFRGLEWAAKEVDISILDWYRDAFGVCEIKEENGRRWIEQRKPPRK